ncbi:MAG: type IV toxin-antitoxin system AbiEi family antitoxin [Planctomycetota bacterium]
MHSEKEEKKAVEDAVRMLEEYLGAEPKSAHIHFGHAGEPPLDRLVDALVKLGQLKFLVEYKSQSFAGRIHEAVKQLKYGGADNLQHYRPLLVVPYMGDVGKKICSEARINWLDLSGNADIRIGQKIRILIEGKPNKFKSRGRPKDLFSPAASRVVRWFLMNPEKRWQQYMIAEEVDASESYISKVVRRLIRAGEVSRDEEGRLRALDPASLMESWRESYDVGKHKVIRGSMFSRSGVELMRQLSSRLKENSVEHAMTGLAGAWLYDHFASFRTVSLYLRSQPSEELLAELGFREGDKAANVWLILPNDMGVFDGARELDGGGDAGRIPVVNQLQVYLDLKSHAERADEAAEHLRANHLNWSRHG